MKWCSLFEVARNVLYNKIIFFISLDNQSDSIENSSILVISILFTKVHGKCTQIDSWFVWNAFVSIDAHSQNKMIAVSPILDPAYGQPWVKNLSTNIYALCIETMHLKISYIHCMGNFQMFLEFIRKSCL